MKNFEKISKMNLADLDRPEGIIEEEKYTGCRSVCRKNSSKSRR
ncbi:MAG: hypothetical protein ACLTS6_07075 [Anaerobutyricum sp.]